MYLFLIDDPFYLFYFQRGQNLLPVSDSVSSHTGGALNAFTPVGILIPSLLSYLWIEKAKHVDSTFLSWGSNL